MREGSEGYMAEMDYVHSYDRHVNPVHMQFCMAASGQAHRPITTACELGYGQGIPVNVHAAASRVRWHGTDFLPEHARFARQLARESGSALELADQSFRDYCQRGDLPDFDYIVVHGIWSWVSDENRRVLVDFIQRKLRAGGVLSISYNTLHGWSEMHPMRDLLNQIAHAPAKAQDEISHRIDAALDFSDALIASTPRIAQNPELMDRLRSMRTGKRRYIAGEYFGREWHPMSFGQVSDWLMPAGLGFACSADHLPAMDARRLTSAQEDLLSSCPSVALQQSVRDYQLGTQFRRDYWVRRETEAWSPALAQNLETSHVVLVGPAVNLLEPPMLGAAYGEVELAGLKALADKMEKHEACLMGDLLEAMTCAGATRDRALQLVCGCVEAGSFAAAQAPADRPDTGGSLRLNEALLRLKHSDAHALYLATPVTGGAVEVERAARWLLQVRNADPEAPEAWAQAAYHAMCADGQTVEPLKAEPRARTDMLADLTRQAENAGRDNPSAWASEVLDFFLENPLPDSQDGLKDMKLRSEVFKTKTLPMLLALGAVPA
ncbi:MAG: class I SAM-dependent methyltransferase [Pseudomonadota bacterium]